MKKVSLLLAVLTLLVGASIATAQNGAETIKYDYSGWFWNPCCGEGVYLDLSYHIVFRQDGIHLNVSGKGTSESGASYVISGKNNQHYNTNENGTVTYTFTNSEVWNAVGANDCDFKFRVVIHVTVNPDGTVTSEVENVEFDCANDTDLS